MGLVFLMSLSSGPVAARGPSRAPLESGYGLRQVSAAEAADDRVMFGCRFGGQTP
jgi:hypothetical protein